MDICLQTRAVTACIKQLIFFIGFPLRFPLFLVPEGLQVGPQLRAKLEVVLRGVLELSWEGLGRPRRAQDGPRRRQDGPRRRQAATRCREHAPRRRRDGPRMSNDKNNDTSNEQEFVWRRLGCIWRPLGDIMGAFGRVLETSGGLFGTFYAVLEMYC